MGHRLLDLPGGQVVLDEEVFEQLRGRSIYIGSNGYAYFSTHATGPVTLHSFAAGGSVTGLHIDHINGNKLDNRRENLRVTTPQINQVNRKALNSNNTSGMRGVAYAPRLSTKRPWRAQIVVNRANKHLGMFATCNEAIAARHAAEIYYYGEKCP